MQLTFQYFCTLYNINAMNFKTNNRIKWYKNNNINTIRSSSFYTFYMVLFHCSSNNCTILALVVMAL